MRRSFLGAALFYAVKFYSYLIHYYFAPYTIYTIFKLV